MNLLLLIVPFICLGSSYSVVNSGPSTTNVQSPIGGKTVVATKYHNAQPNIIDGSFWIWTNASTKAATFQTLFYGRYVGNAYINIKADSSYNVTFNGQYIKSGIRFALENFYVNLGCGINNLTIQVENADPSATTSGLVFLISQSDNMVTCNTNYGFYNFTSCNCQCLGDFSCGPAQLKLAYPTCGCACASQGVRCNDLRQFYDLKTCSCKCFPVYCQTGFQQDPDLCTCRCYPKIPCTNGTLWNYNQCRCL